MPKYKYGRIISSRKTAEFLFALNNEVSYISKISEKMEKDQSTVFKEYYHPLKEAKIVMHTNLKKKKSFPNKSSPIKIEWRRLVDFMFEYLIIEYRAEKRNLKNTKSVLELSELLKTYFIQNPKYEKGVSLVNVFENIFHKVADDLARARIDMNEVDFGELVVGIDISKDEEEEATEKGVNTLLRKYFFHLKHRKNAPTKLKHREKEYDFRKGRGWSEIEPDVWKNKSVVLRFGPSGIGYEGK